MMKIPFFDLKRVYEFERAEIEKAALETLQSGHYILGTKCKQFESDLKNYLVKDGAGSAVGCNSGTDAIVLALLALNVGPGDEVITVSHTAIPTITAIQATGATPVFADIDPATWVLDGKQAISKITPKTKAIIGVHLYGNMVDVDFILNELEKMKSPVTLIEDVAQAQGSTLKDRQAGTIARFGCYSFYPTKNVGALGDGGAIFAKSSEDASRLMQLRYYGQKDRYHADIARGLNSRLDEIQAAILSVRLKSLDKGSKQKAKQMQIYRSELSGLPIEFQAVTKDCAPAWHLAVIALESEKVRNDLQTYLDKNGIQTLIHYPIPTHLQPAFSKARAENLKVTEQLTKRILSLPINVGLLENEQLAITKAIRMYFA